MNNLILYIDNHGSISGKFYGIGAYGCNYPVVPNSPIFALDVTNGSNIATTTDDLTYLLGCDLQNSNTPRYAFLISEVPCVLEVRNLIDEHTLVLKTPFTGSTGLYDFNVIDIFGQPTVEQTYAIDSSAGAPTAVNVVTKYGMVDVEVNTTPIPLGSDPILVDFATDFATSALNIQYSSYDT